MRALTTLIPVVALLAIAGYAVGQNNPCPECDPDGDPNMENAYHSVDAGVVDGNTTEVLADTDAAHSHDGDEKGLWAWFSLCLSAFAQHVEDLLGVETDADANVAVYADSEGVDLDASVTGLAGVCEAADLTAEDCVVDFDKSELGDVDGMTYEVVAGVEAATGEDVFAPALVPDTGDSDTDACVESDLTVCG